MNEMVRKLVLESLVIHGAKIDIPDETGETVQQIFDTNWKFHSYESIFKK